MCKPGYYCPSGALVELSCPLGTFNPEYAQGVCTPCTPGYVCDTLNMTSVTGKECPRGFYCPLGTITPKKCPAGRWSSLTARPNFTDCALCPAGKWCGNQNLTIPVGQSHKKNSFKCTNKLSHSPSPPPFASPQHTHVANTHAHTHTHTHTRTHTHTTFLGRWRLRRRVLLRSRIALAATERHRRASHRRVMARLRPMPPRPLLPQRHAVARAVRGGALQSEARRPQQVELR